MSQTVVNLDMVVAFEGLLATSANKLTDGTRTAKLAIPFGRSVQNVSGSADEVELIASGGTFFGISHSTQANEQSLSGIVEYENLEPANILRQGIVWVFTEQAVVAFTSGVFTRFVAGPGGTVIGRFRTDADTASAVEITNAVYLTTTTGADFAQVQINLP